MNCRKTVSLCAIAALVVFSAVRTHAALPKGPDAFPSFTNDGVWTWYGEPKAVYFEGTHKRTYVGWTSQTGKESVAYYDHETGQTKVKVLQKSYGKDDHDHPSLIMRPDGRLLVFNTGHDGQEITEYISLQPESIDSFQIVSPYPVSGSWYCYPNALFLKNEGTKGRFFLFHRGTDTDPYFTYSDDWGMTWAPDKHYFANNPHAAKPYCKYGTNGIDEIHIIIERAHRAGYCPAYYLKYKGGAFYQITGEKLGDTNSLPIMNTVIDTVQDANGWHVTCWDAAEDKKGNPVALIDKFNGTPANHHCWYFHWTGSSWFKKEMLNTGGTVGAEDGFACGFTLDHENANIVYVATWVGAAPEIQKWTTCDWGTTWKTQSITTGSAKKNYRPCVPRGHKSGMKCNLVWLYGDYSSLSGYATSVKYLDEVMTDDSSSCTPVTGSVAGRTAAAQGITIRSSGIEFTLVNPSRASLLIYSPSGRLAANLTPLMGGMTADRVLVPYSSMGCNNGTYLVRFDNGKTVQTKEMVIVR
jgi:hypothetical protein